MDWGVSTPRVGCAMSPDSNPGAPPPIPVDTHGRFGDDPASLRLRETHHAPMATLGQGRALRNQLAALLRGSLGLESDRLVAFGVATRRRHSRRLAAATAKADGPPVS